MPIVFCDLETTGLDPSVDDVAEIAVIITDDKLNELGRFERVISLWYARDCQLWFENPGDQPALDRLYGAIGRTIDPYVLNMRGKNSLWQASADSENRRFEIDLQAREWLMTTLGVDKLGEKIGPQLAGNTINFDRAFLRTHFPHIFKSLHYHNIDLSTMNEMAKRFNPDLYSGRPGQNTESTHRSMSDCDHSLALARYYAANLADGVKDAA